MKPHIKRFTDAAKTMSRDFWQGHAYVNLFAEYMRCRGVPDRIIKARFGPFGPQHIIAILAPIIIVYGIKQLIHHFI